MQILLCSFLGLCCIVGTFAQTVIRGTSEDNVTLPCKHRLGLLGRNLDIEWLSNDSNHGQKVILSYSGGQVYEHEELKGRYSFYLDFLAGDADIFIRSLTPSDAGPYTCKVKNAGQYEWSYITLKVLVKPSEPSCWIEGDKIVGRNVTLHCRSTAGSEPMKYHWQRLKRQEYSPTLHVYTQKLLMQNVSKADNGSYRCTVSNDAGKRICDLHLAVETPSNVAFLAGVTCGSVGGVLLLLLICWYLFRKRELKKREEDEFLNEIKEDAEAPKARLMKPGSSSSGSRSSRSGSSSTRSTTNSASRSQRTLSTQEASHGDSRHHCLEQI
ncbi:CXADR-like membrane protein [Bufo bufo]|uniref:CXADR-like membrane protein n=1 Tax=Bufo bufo TaxID=8384 RepID=UPI001ABE4703|nr:CXADR-like membrane protein [Bufo bufo]